MKRFLSAVMLSAVLFQTVPLQTRAEELLIPVGEIIGLQLRSDTITVAAYDDVLGANARSAGLKIGDEILRIGDTPVTCTEDIREALRTCRDSALLTVRRGNSVNKLELTPCQTEDGPRLGVYLRQGIAGIGTVTFYDPDTGLFGTLGHGVSDARGSLLKMVRGSAYEAEILSVKKGKRGDPGQLKGSARSVAACGQLLRNTPQGVFGIREGGWSGEAIPLADYPEIQTGPATIRCQVSSEGVRDYSVEILKIYPRTRSDGRNFLIRITDPNLLNQTGGIVQGMSGSPIIQDGKLVGAVTHVLVNDPTRGYGIFIENMLEAAE
ncbi:MAG: SpoIVB peptidase [Oscillospiraceae bacterium]|nr:SpoIVB peptidase [Oscillospiraceae bacterium]